MAPTRNMPADSESCLGLQIGIEYTVAGPFDGFAGNGEAFDQRHQL